MRDEGDAYGRRLIKAGVDVVTKRYNATIHFVLLNALATAALIREALTEAGFFEEHTSSKVLKEGSHGSSILPEHQSDAC